MELAARLRVKFNRRKSNSPSLAPTGSATSSVDPRTASQHSSEHPFIPEIPPLAEQEPLDLPVDHGHSEHKDDHNVDIDTQQHHETYTTTTSPNSQREFREERASSFASGTTANDSSNEGSTSLGVDKYLRPTSAASGNDQRPPLGRLHSIKELPSAPDRDESPPPPPAAPSVDAAASISRAAAALAEEEDGRRNNYNFQVSSLERSLADATPIAAPASHSSDDAAAGTAHITAPAVTISPGSPPTTDLGGATQEDLPTPTTPIRPLTALRTPSQLAARRSSPINSLLSPGASGSRERSLSPGQTVTAARSKMGNRKIWVKRPGASATLVTINEDDVVDDVRDMILRKYSNSLGRQFDSPDLTLRIRPREQLQERTLGPEEPMGRTLDAYYPGGQAVDEALIIDVPLRRTPRASPRTGPPHMPHVQSVMFGDEVRPLETGNDYFGPSAVTTHSVQLPITIGQQQSANGVVTAHPHAISILSTGQVPQIPSPGATRKSQAYRDRPERPRLGRQHTSSPTIINLASGGHAAHHGSIAAAAVSTIGAGGAGGSNASENSQRGPGSVHSHSRQRSRTRSNASSEHSPMHAPIPPPLPEPPLPNVQNPAMREKIGTPPLRTSSPRPSQPRAKKSKRNVENLSLPKGMLNGSVPPINVLIVEDNIINLKLLEAFVKRLKVRWQTAMNGRDAVVKWRTGGFHLVLMDIQLPIMSGLDATREIRRLERVNSIGVFSSVSSTAPSLSPTSDGGEHGHGGEVKEEDKLNNMDTFKSPVIIVALTASSLQSDRHEALAAGCNDFLTKPVNFVWLERKVMEWGCMQALIDFDGWKKWKEISQKAEEEKLLKGKTATTKSFKSRKVKAVA